MKQVTTPMPTPTAQAVANQDSFTNFTVDLIETITHLDIVALLKAIGAWIFFIWAFFSVWVLLDAYKRYKNPIVPFLWFLFILPFNLLGFLGYLFIRPTFTREEEMYIELDRQFLIYEVNKLVTCPACGNVYDNGTRYCANCGTSLIVKCSKCKAEMPISYKYCTNCGESLFNHSTLAHRVEGGVRTIANVPGQSATNSTKRNAYKSIAQASGKTVYKQAVSPVNKPGLGKRIFNALLNISDSVYYLLSALGHSFYSGTIFLVDSVVYAFKILFYPFILIGRALGDILAFPLNMLSTSSISKDKRLSKSSSLANNPKTQKPPKNSKSKSSKQSSRSRRKKTKGVNKSNGRTKKKLSK